MFTLADGEFEGDHISAIRSVAATGFTETELSAEGPEWQSVAGPDPRPYRKMLDESGVWAHTIHAPFTTVNLASFNEDERVDGVERVAGAMRFLAELGGRTIIVHSTGKPTDPKAEPYYTLVNVGKATENAHRSITDLIAVAEETNVRLALENLPGRGSPRPLETMQELRSFMADLPEKYVGICHDVGHSRLRHLDIADEARIASERLYALHIQDGSTTDDDHLPPGHGVLNFDAFGKALNDINFDGAWTLEVLGKNHPGTIEDVAIECAAIHDQWREQGMGDVKPR